MVSGVDRDNPGMRLATFNTLHGASMSDGVVDPARFASAVADLHADVLVLQEVDRGQPRSHGLDLTAVAADAMGATAARFVPALRGTPGHWQPADPARPEVQGYGIALLSRWPVLDWRVLRLPVLPIAVPRAARRGTGRLRWVRDEPRVAVAARVQAPHGAITVVATHLSFLPGWNAWQLHRLVRACRALPRPLLIAGDLNLPWPVPARISGLRAVGPVHSFPVDAPDRQIDHVLWDGPLAVTAGPVAVDTGVSDHRAVVVELDG